jgi:hypothetical protein
MCIMHGYQEALVFCWMQWGTNNEKNLSSRQNIYFHNINIYGASARNRIRDTLSLPRLIGIRACAVDNLDRNYKNRNIYILWDSQAAIKELGKY